MHASTISSLALALGASIATAAPSSPVNAFHVTKFRTHCTENHECTSTFNVKYDNRDNESYDCSIPSPSDGYIYCQTPQPEISVAGAIEGKKHGLKTLKLRRETQLPGAAPQDMYGETILTQPQEPDFYVLVSNGSE